MHRAWAKQCHVTTRQGDDSDLLSGEDSLAMVDPKIDEVCVGRTCEGDNFEWNQEVPDPESHKTERGQW